MKNELKALAVVVGMALASAACGGEKTAEPPATVAAAPATQPGTAMMAALEFGVPECDSYMAKYRACLDSKVPADARPMLKQSLDQVSAAWRQAAATPQGKAGLAAGCVQAEAMAKQSLAPYGCTF